MGSYYRFTRGRMRTKRSSMFKFVASLAVSGFLFGVTAAGAATHAQNLSQPPISLPKSQKPAVGSIKNKQDFFRALEAEGVGSCKSSCCWAIGCDGTSCSSVACHAWCGDSDANYVC
jgi:hypothetical protein